MQCLSATDLTRFGEEASFLTLPFFQEHKKKKLGNDLALLTDIETGFPMFNNGGVAGSG